MNDTKKTESRFLKRIDPIVFSVALVLFVILLFWGMSGSLDAPVSALITFLEYKCGFVYLIFGFVAVALCVYLAVSPYGKVVLGGDGEKPKYSFFSWFCMIFACGYGVGLVYWGAAEPLSFFLNPPMGYAAGAAETADFALSYAYFHWGFTAWAVYAIVSVPLAYFVNRKGFVPRFSATLSPLSQNFAGGRGGRTIEGIIIVCLLCGLTTSVGLAIMQMAGGLEYLFGIPINTKMYLVIGVLWTALIVSTAVSGVDKGIKLLSNINIPLAVALMVAVLVFGPTDFCLNLGTSALGKYFDGFLNMSFWTDAAGQSGFPQGWTIFYWAWWLSCSPIVGIFVANISRGRTIRQLVVTMLGAASLGTFIWFAIFGGSAIFMEMNGIADLSGIMAEKGTNYVVYVMLEKLPMAKILSILFVLLIAIFMATSTNSAAFICSQMSTKDSENPMNPPKAVTGFWSMAVCVLGIALLIVGKGISGLQTTSIVGSVLLLFIAAFMVISFLKELRKEKV